MPVAIFTWGVAAIGAVAVASYKFSNQETMQKNEFTKKAIQAKAWDELPTRAILKVADKDLKTYFLKEQEYALIVRDFQAYRNQVESNTTAVKQVLNRLRSSPFFDDAYRPEYDALWALVTTNKPEKITCQKLCQLFPEEAFEKAFQVAFDCAGTTKDKVINLEDAFAALEMKLRSE